VEHIAFANVGIACGFGVCAHGTGWNSALGACGDHAGKGFIRAPFGDEAVGLIASLGTRGEITGLQDAYSAGIKGRIVRLSAADWSLSKAASDGQKIRHVRRRSRL